MVCLLCVFNVCGRSKRMRVVGDIVCVCCVFVVWLCFELIDSGTLRGLAPVTLAARRPSW